MIYRLVKLVAIGLLLLLDFGCQNAGVNAAAPGIVQLQTNNQKVQQHTTNATNDVQDAKDMVRRIEYKDTLLSR